MVTQPAKAAAYNGANVPIFAPDGFPEFARPQLTGKAFGSTEFAEGVAKVQKELGLTADGYCGPGTIAAMAARDKREKGANCVVIGPRAYPVPFKVVTWEEDAKLGTVADRKREKVVRQVVLHYDVAFTSAAALDTLLKRGLSYNFLIDGDKGATVYQTKNPTLATCLHAAEANSASVGVCMNNPADVTYRAQDEKRRGRVRGQGKFKVHSGTADLLLFFPEQIANMKVLVHTLCQALKIPYEGPKDAKGNYIYGVLPDPAKYHGVMGHYHWTTRKIDPAQIAWEILHQP